MKTHTMYIKGMHCRSCEMLVEDVILQIPGIKKVEVDHLSGKLNIHYIGDTLPTQKIHQAIVASGYAVGQEIKPRFTNNTKIWLDNIIATAVLSAVGIFLSMTGKTELFNFHVTSAVGFSGMLVVGLIAGVSTCMAIVGGIILSLSAKRSQEHQQQTRIKKFKPQLYFHVGRLLGFALLGGMLGLIGSIFQISDRGYMFIFIIVGIVLLLSGLQLTQLMPKISAYHIHFPKGIQRFVKQRGEEKGMYIEASITGLATFFVPCGFTIIAQAYAASTGSFVGGAVVMVGFAIGTLPGLLGIGGLASLLKGRRGQTIFRGLGIVLIAFAIYNFSLAQNYHIALQNKPEKIQDTTQNIPDSQKQSVDIHIVQDGHGYSPNNITIPKNSIIHLTIDSQDQYTCASSFWIPSKNIKVFLKPGDNAITFTTDSENAIPFGCSMMMYRGQFIVQ